MEANFKALGHTVSIEPTVGTAPLLASGPAQGPIGKKEIGEAAAILRKYKDGKANLEARIVENERWYKIQHWEVMRGNNAKQGDPEPASAWLFNSLDNKHADAMDNYPDPAILPREEGDRADAQSLSEIVPVIVERNEFEQTYSDAWWYKLKNGTGPYGVFWDKELENGLGDIAINKLDLLNIFWEPGITNIQKSRNLFIADVMDDDLIRETYPWVNNTDTETINVKQYVFDDTVDTTGKSVVVDWYYKRKGPDGRTRLHLVKFVGDTLLYASENDPEYADRGIYDHGKYPVVFDVLFPEEGMPVGFGYVDVMRNPQMYIDKLDQIILKNALMSGKKRILLKDSCGINEDEFTDWSKDIIHTSGSLNDDNYREFQVSPLAAFILQHKQTKVDELKETSGNRDFSQGSTSGGVTAAAAIAALQEAGNKLSRDMIKGAYRADAKIIGLCIELMRQFYDEQRSFRIEGPEGVERFIEYSNAHIKEQQMLPAYPGAEPAWRIPIFDIKIKPQKSNPFSRAAQNELAKELYGMGFFNPQLADQAMIALELMDFEGKQKVKEQISKNGQLMQMVMMLQQQVAKLAALVDKAYGTDMTSQLAGTGQEGAGNKVATGSKDGMAQTAGAAAKNASTSYGERLADRATPDVSKQTGVKT